MATIHIPEDEAARDFAGLLARVRAGDEIVIEKEAAPGVVLRAAVEPRGRLLSESIALAEARAAESGTEPVRTPMLRPIWKRSSGTAAPAKRWGSGPVLRFGSDSRAVRRQRRRNH
jgi:antitoxin (DNA-binding transcriptional repressor) of toxin-antitoxin stability system